MLFTETLFEDENFPSLLKFLEDGRRVQAAAKKKKKKEQKTEKYAIRAVQFLDNFGKEDSQPIKEKTNVTTLVITLKFICPKSKPIPQDWPRNHSL